VSTTHEFAYSEQAPKDILRQSAENNATLSSCCGYTGEVTLTDSAVIILLAGALGAGDMLSIITTSLLPFFNGLFVLPMAFVAMRIGIRRLINVSCGLSALAYFAAVASPWFGDGSRYALLMAIVLFSFSLTGFISGWFPLADTFLTHERRIHFFSRMRFCHQLTAVTFLTVAGFLIGKQSPVWKLQLLLGVAAVIYVGRLLFIRKIPHLPLPKGYEPIENMWTALRQAIGNRPLVGFSLYVFMLNLAAYGTVPLTLLYLKKSLQAPDNVIVLISASALCGMLFGYLVVRRMVDLLTVKHALLLFHLALMAVNASLFLIGSATDATFVLIGILLFAYNFTIASASVVTASEMMRLSAGSPRTISMALFSTFYYGGFGISRLLASLLLGSGLLATEWFCYGHRITHYQTLFLFFTVFILLAAVFLMIVPAIITLPEHGQDNTQDENHSGNNATNISATCNHA